jgi:hypothetical protein
VNAAPAPPPATAPAPPAAPPPSAEVDYAGHLATVAAERFSDERERAVAVAGATNLTAVRLAESDLQQAAIVPPEQRPSYVRSARDRLAALDLAREALGRLIDEAESGPDAPAGPEGRA